MELSAFPQRSNLQGDGLLLMQAEKGRAFRALHQRSGAFIIPNPWDIGTARLLAHLGFEALATTSAGFAASVGRRDYAIGRDEMIAHVAAMAAATSLPVSADLQNGFGDAPEAAAETIGLAAAAGAVGGSIEDSTGRPDQPIYEFEHAVERVRAAAQRARSLPFDFTLTARAENFLNGRADLKDTILRLQAYQEAGADVLYAPGLAGKEDIRQIVASIDRPLNVLIGMSMHLTVPQLQELGVTRISLGGSLARAAYGALMRAATEILTAGSFDYTAQAASGKELNGIFAIPN